MARGGHEFRHRERQRSEPESSEHDGTPGTQLQNAIITPNLCNDMHDSCAPTNDSIRQGDNWLSKVVPKILASSAYANGGMLFVTWDEAASGDGPIGMIVTSQFAKGGGYSNTIHYTHSSALRSFQEILGVVPFLGDAAPAFGLSAACETGDRSEKKGDPDRSPSEASLEPRGSGAHRALACRDTALWRPI